MADRKAEIRNKKKLQQSAPNIPIGPKTHQKKNLDQGVYKKPGD